jgi:hypothetical protein
MRFGSIHLTLKTRNKSSDNLAQLIRRFAVFSCRRPYEPTLRPLIGHKKPLRAFTARRGFLGVPGMGVIQSGEMSAPDLAVGTVAKDKGTAVRDN